ncbi:MAG: ComEA family DNA-binding protein [Planctomycetota bacterium]|jgi:competence ComEA-like helix-hairpin-helix protein
MSQIFQKQSDQKCKITHSLAFVIALVLAQMLSAFFLFSHFSKSTLSNRIVLENKINPNYAPVCSLSRLSGIGLGRANAIIDYRKKFKKDNPNVLPFLKPNDLQKIKGIGPKTVENIQPFLKFQSHMP